MLVHPTLPFPHRLATPPALLPFLEPIPSEATLQHEIRQITALLTERYAAQEAQDVSSYMQCFWNSSLVAYLTEEYVAIGWAQVKANVRREFSTRPVRSRPILERLRANLLDAHTAFTIEWWTLLLPLSKVSGFTSCTWHKFPGGWRIIQAHTDSTRSR